MGNICGSTKTINDSPTHHRLGSISDPPPSTANTAATGTTPDQRDNHDHQGNPGHLGTLGRRVIRKRGKGGQKLPRSEPKLRVAIQAAARGTNASNPKQGQLAAKANKPVTNQPYQREEEPLRWD
ncbi:hypothetical protein RhiJN_19305 [Ceratobasidium sp. AG-Ba]|nr:hypothetical protein RhiJN_19305 [Ceratobasidium sp. AG-Ba]